MMWKKMEKNMWYFYEEGMNRRCADLRPSRFLNRKEAAQHLSDPQFVL